MLLVAVCDPPTGCGRLEALLEPLLTAVPGATAVVIAQSPTPHLAVLAPTSTPPADLFATARNTLADRLRLYALPAAPLHELAEAYQQLAVRLELADALADSNGILCPHRLAIYQLLAIIPAGQAQQFITSTLAPLLARPATERTRLLTTLQALWATGNVADAARGLGYERRTTHRHLIRIAELTGLDARQTGPRQQLALALGLWQLHRHRLPPPGTPTWTATPPP